MDCDTFHLLVYLCFSMPYLHDNTTLSSVPCGNINEAYIFKLILQVHFVQILLKKIQLNSFEETIECIKLKNQVKDIEQQANVKSIELLENNKSNQVRSFKRN
jgi:hypothetical protein